MPVTSVVYHVDFNPFNVPPRKICKKCKQEMDRKEFKTVPTFRDCKDSMCIPCRDESNREKGRKQLAKRREDDKYFT